MALSHTRTLASNPSMDPSLEVFTQMEQKIHQIKEWTELTKERAKKLLASIREKNLPIHVIQEKLKNNPQALAILNKLLPNQNEVTERERNKLVATKVGELETERKEKIAKSFRAVEKLKEFSKETWEVIKKSVGFVSDGIFFVLKKLPVKTAMVAVGLLLLLGSVPAVLSFLSLAEGIIPSTATFGALTEIVSGLTPEAFVQMAESLKGAFSTTSLGYPI